MLLLTATTDSLQFNTGSALSLDWSCGYVDINANSFGPGSAQGNVSTATNTTIAAAPASGYQRQIKTITCVNRDATNPQTVTVQKVWSGGTVNLTPAISLSAGESLQYTDTEGFTVLTALGQIKTVGSPGPTGATGAAGAAGIPGADGDTPDDGLPGPMGLTGATGAQGPIGPSIIVEDGQDGQDAFISGPQGPQGATGAQGPIGPTLIVEDGNPGDDSFITGPQGPAGAPGAAGAAGMQGVPGFFGEDGADGEMGPPGSNVPAGPLAIAGPIAGPSTTINSTTTPTSGGITLPNQIAIGAASGTGAAWRIKAYGSFSATNSGTARNALIQVFWGSTSLITLTIAVLTSTTQVTGFECEFVLGSSSATAMTCSGGSTNRMGSATLVSYTEGTQVATAVTAGPQTLDLRFSESAVVSGDFFTIHNVVMERIK